MDRFNLFVGGIGAPTLQGGSAKPPHNPHPTTTSPLHAVSSRYRLLEQQHQQPHHVPHSALQYGTPHVSVGASGEAVAALLSRSGYASPTRHQHSHSSPQALHSSARRADPESRIVEDRLNVSRDLQSSAVAHHRALTSSSGGTSGGGSGLVAASRLNPSMYLSRNTVTLRDRGGAEGSARAHDDNSAGRFNLLHHSAGVATSARASPPAAPSPRLVAAPAASTFSSPASAQARPDSSSAPATAAAAATSERSSTHRITRSILDTVADFAGRELEGELRRQERLDAHAQAAITQQQRARSPHQSTSPNRLDLDVDPDADPRVHAWRIYKAVLGLVLEDLGSSSASSVASSEGGAGSSVDYQRERSSRLSRAQEAVSKLDAMLDIMLEEKEKGDVSRLLASASGLATNRDGRGTGPGSRASVLLQSLSSPSKRQQAAASSSSKLPPMGVPDKDAPAEVLLMQLVDTLKAESAAYLARQQQKKLEQEQAARLREVETEDDDDFDETDDSQAYDAADDEQPKRRRANKAKQGAKASKPASPRTPGRGVGGGTRGLASPGPAIVGYGPSWSTNKPNLLAKVKSSQAVGGGYGLPGLQSPSLAAAASANANSPMSTSRSVGTGATPAAAAAAAAATGPSGYRRARTLYHFQGLRENGEVSFPPGVDVIVMQMHHAQWWYGEVAVGGGASEVAKTSTSTLSLTSTFGTQRGWFPKTYVRLLNDDGFVSLSSATSPERGIAPSPASTSKTGATLSGQSSAGAGSLMSPSTLQMLMDLSPQQLVEKILQSLASGSLPPTVVAQAAEASRGQGKDLAQELLSVVTALQQQYRRKERATLAAAGGSSGALSFSPQPSTDAPPIPAHLKPLLAAAGIHLPGMAGSGGTGMGASFFGKGGTSGSSDANDTGEGSPKKGKGQGKWRPSGGVDLFTDATDDEGGDERPGQRAGGGNSDDSSDDDIDGENAQTILSLRGLSAKGSGFTSKASLNRSGSANARGKGLAAVGEHDGDGDEGRGLSSRRSSITDVAGALATAWATGAVSADDEAVDALTVTASGNIVPKAAGSGGGGGGGGGTAGGSSGGKGRGGHGIGLRDTDEEDSQDYNYDDDNDGDDDNVEDDASEREEEDRRRRELEELQALTPQQRMHRLQLRSAALTAADTGADPSTIQSLSQDTGIPYDAIEKEALNIIRIRSNALRRKEKRRAKRRLLMGGEGGDGDGSGSGSGSGSGHGRMGMGMGSFLKGHDLDDLGSPLSAAGHHHRTVHGHRDGSSGAEDGSGEGHHSSAYAPAAIVGSLPTTGELGASGVYGGSVAEQPATPAPEPQQQYQVVVQPDGRRVKVLVMTGHELWDLFRPKMRAFAMAMQVCRKALLHRRMVKAAAVGLFMRLAFERRMAKYRAKVFLLGLAKTMYRQRRIDAARPKVFALGIMQRFHAIQTVQAQQALARALNSAMASGARGSTTVSALRAGGAAANKEPVDPNAPKTRAVQWDAIQESSVVGTIWDREGIAKTKPNLLARPASMKLDVNSLMPVLVEKFTIASANNAAGGGKGGAAGAAGDGTPGAGGPGTPGGKAGVKNATAFISLLPNPQKAQNVGIALSNVIGKRKLEDVKAAIMTLDEEALGGGLDRVQILVNLGVYDDESIGPVKEYDGDSARLALPERFIKEVVMAIPAISTRLSVMEFKLQLPELHDTSREKLDTVTGACNEISNSAKFATLLLDVILPLGNKLNTLSRKGAAAGFKISSLSKLVHTKSASGETFLRFIVEGLLERSPKLLEVSSDFPILLRAKGPAVNIAAVSENVAKIDKGIRQVESLLTRAKATNDALLTSRLTPLLGTAKSHVAALREDLRKCNAIFEELCRWLGEDPGKTNPEALFAIVQSFLSSLGQEAKAARERADRAAKAAARKEKEDEAKAKKAATASNSPATSVGAAAAAAALRRKSSQQVASSPAMQTNPNLSPRTPVSPTNANTPVAAQASAAAQRKMSRRMSQAIVSSLLKGQDPAASPEVQALMQEAALAGGSPPSNDSPSSGSGSGRSGRPSSASPPQPGSARSGGSGSASGSLSSSSARRSSSRSPAPAGAASSPPLLPSPPAPHIHHAPPAMPPPPGAKRLAAGNAAAAVSPPLSSKYQLPTLAESGADDDEDEEGDGGDAAIGLLRSMSAPGRRPSSASPRDRAPSPGELLRSVSHGVGELSPGKSAAAKRNSVAGAAVAAAMLASVQSKHMMRSPSSPVHGDGGSGGSPNGTARSMLINEETGTPVVPTTISDVIQQAELMAASAGNSAAGSPVGMMPPSPVGMGGSRSPASPTGGLGGKRMSIFDMRLKQLEQAAQLQDSQPPAPQMLPPPPAVPTISPPSAAAAATAARRAATVGGVALPGPPPLPAGPPPGAGSPSASVRSPPGTGRLPGPPGTSPPPSARPQPGQGALPGPPPIPSSVPSLSSPSTRGIVSGASPSASLLPPPPSSAPPPTAKPVAVASPPASGLKLPGPPSSTPPPAAAPSSSRGASPSPAAGAKLPPPPSIPPPPGSSASPGAKPAVVGTSSPLATLSFKPPPPSAAPPASTSPSPGMRMPPPPSTPLPPAAAGATSAKSPLPPKGAISTPPGAATGLKLPGPPSIPPPPSALAAAAKPLPGPPPMAATPSGLSPGGIPTGDDLAKALRRSMRLV